MTIELDRVELPENLADISTKDENTLVTDARESAHPAFEAINWNNVPELEKDIWGKLLSQFWLPEKVPLANDVKSWGTLTDQEKQLVLKVFSGLTLLDTIQGRFGAISITRDARSLFEEAVLANIAFMEHVHARSYSSIFTTLSNTRDINEAFRWSSENEFLRKKQEIVMARYRDYSQDVMSQQKKKIVSVLLESFLFYSGFYLPLYFNGQAKLTNTADIIRLILRDESIHGHYLGAKFQQVNAELTAAQREELQDWTYDTLQELYENEIRYTQDLYDSLGLTEDVKSFLRYNANKALSNLGYDPLFPRQNVNPVILTQLDLTQETHDFFSGSGSSYQLNVQEDSVLDEEEWDF